MSSESLQRTTDHLSAITAKIERGEGTLGKLVQDDSLFFAAKDSLKKVGRTADQFRDQSTVGVIGSAVGVLF